MRTFEGGRTRDWVEEFPKGDRSLERIRNSGVYLAEVHVIPMITFVLALIAFVIAIVNGMGKGRAPLWLAVALMALGLMLPWMANLMIR